MFRAIVLTCLVVLCVCLVNGLQPELLINNGPEANILDFPYALSLRRNGVHIGGGVIITNNWALSAAHILLGCPPTQLTCRAGSSERLLGGTLHNANMILIHNAFNPWNLDNNIAIFGVMEPFVFSATIASIALDVQGEWD